MRHTMFGGNLVCSGNSSWCFLCIAMKVRALDSNTHAEITLMAAALIYSALYSKVFRDVHRKDEAIGTCLFVSCILIY